MKKHLAIFSRAHIKEIFGGKRAIDLRISKKRIPPFGVISIGDLVYIKPPGEEVVGQYKVKKLIFFEGLEEKDWEVVESFYGKLEKKQFYKYASLIFMDEVEQFITSPIKIKKGDSRGWMVLN